jgi:endonuclease/exonuclease/phosphatase family metal-dependent hydrolase
MFFDRYLGCTKKMWSSKKFFAICLCIVFLLPAMTLAQEKRDKNICTVSPTPIVPYTKMGNWSSWRAKIATFNVWGLKLFSRYKKERMPKIGDTLRSYDVDYALLQEAWTTEDRQDIYTHAGLPYITYADLNYTVGSGLFSLTKHPYKNRTFMPFTLNGGFGRLWEGEVFAGKGVTMATVIINGLTVSIFNLHTIARHGFGTSSLPEDRYTPERLAQLFEIFQHVVEHTDSDAFIVAGDFNMRWLQTEFHFWRQLTSLEGNTLEEDDKITCTSCKDNVFNSNPNGQVDYVFVSPRLKIAKNTLSFKNRITTPQGYSINMSDHYGWISKIMVNPDRPHIQPEMARHQLIEMLGYLEGRLYKYLGKQLPIDEDDFPEDFGGIQDRLCIRCRIKDTIRKVNIYQKILTPNAQLTETQKIIKMRLESYFSLFN